MYKGKAICNTLKQVRLQVARANEIPYEPTECKHEGDCLGTCPKCEQEVRFLERELELRRSLGKAVSIVGISVGLAALTSCRSHVENKTQVDGMLEHVDDDHKHPEVAGIPPIPQGQIRGTDSVVVDSVAPEKQNVKETDSLVVLSDTLNKFMFFGDVVETQPSFPGGQRALLQFISDNLVYPKDLGETCIQGRVVVSFVVDRDGSIIEPKVVRPLHPSLDEEALRVIGLMPKWRPGKLMAVKVKYNIPIKFTLDSDQNKEQ